MIVLCSGELGTPMVSRKAKEVLEPLICNNVEFLPLTHDVTGEVYYLINVLNTIDAIDYNKAVLKTKYRINNRFRKIRIFA